MSQAALISPQLRMCHLGETVSWICMGLHWIATSSSYQPSTSSFLSWHHQRPEAFIIVPSQHAVQVGSGRCTAAYAWDCLPLRLLISSPTHLLRGIEQGKHSAMLTTQHASQVLWQKSHAWMQLDVDSQVTFCCPRLTSALCEVIAQSQWLSRRTCVWQPRQL